MINSTKLSAELRAAGITTHGNCNSNGIVWDDDNNEIQSRPDVASILANHNPNSPSWEEVRTERDRLLAECDWTQVVDAPLSENEKELWAAYRQLLRDLPQRFDNTEDVVYPTKPGGNQ